MHLYLSITPSFCFCNIWDMCWQQITGVDCRIWAPDASCWGCDITDISIHVATCVCTYITSINAALPWCSSSFHYGFTSRWQQGVTWCLLTGQSAFCLTAFDAECLFLEHWYFSFSQFCLACWIFDSCYWLYLMLKVKNYYCWNAAENFVSFNGGEHIGECWKCRNYSVLQSATSVLAAVKLLNL